NSYALPASSAEPGRSISTDLLIGDRWRPGGEGQRIDVLNPSTGEVLASVADATIKDGIEAIEAASRAASSWAATPPRKRAELLRSCYERMVANSEWLAQLISLENGKALADAKGEV